MGKKLEYMNIINSSIGMRSTPSEVSTLETECLFGEKLKILDNFNNWYFCKLETDNYCGWVKKNNLGYLNSPTHRVISSRTCLFSEKNVKSQFIHYVPLGSKLHVKKIEYNWAEISLSNKHFYKTGYASSNHLIEINQIVDDWVAIAEQLIGTPYKYGGRDSVALDCSALIQLSYQAYGQSIPRNTKDQVQLDKTIINNPEQLNRGCVVFWEGHVGVMVDKYNCLHSNAYHMKTIIESLSKISDRMGNNHKIIKMMDFKN